MFNTKTHIIKIIISKKKKNLINFLISCHACACGCCVGVCTNII